MLPTYVRDGCRPDFDVEIARGPDRNAADMDTGIFAFGHDRPHHVPGLETVNALLPHQVTTREPVFVNASALIAPAAHGRNKQHGLLPAVQETSFARTRRVQAVCLGHAQATAIILGTAARRGLNRQPGRDQ
jgi:hypothetical protein